MGVARRAPSSDPGSAFVGAILSEKKIVKEIFFFPLSTLNRYYSVPIGREEPFPTTPVLEAILTEKKIVIEKFFFPLFLLNSYNSAPIGQILI
ncbi:LOW QUALITY PROTEIN: hypothetical protein V1477_017792 [Vespula maculifrons]|uniref:Uncharacterized protein n=1 Tax=Vespula maculifrons TaxID=7453 RepID=A0ABD2B1F2_VESMC